MRQTNVLILFKHSLRLAPLGNVKDLQSYGSDVLILERAKCYRTTLLLAINAPRGFLWDAWKLD
jgi:hypothetical protein